MTPVPVLTFFNNKGGVGKTSLVYHLAWMFSQLGKTVVACDLDPQTNLTAAFLDDDTIEGVWNNSIENSTIFRSIQPSLEGRGDIASPTLQKITEYLYLIPGDIALSGFEDSLAEQWPNSMGENNLYRAMRLLSAFWQVMQMGANEAGADIILADIGPNLGAINRSALIASDFVVIPLGADLFSLQGLRNLGPTLRNWQRAWNKRLDNWTESRESAGSNLSLPEGKMKTVGYVCQQHSERLNRPVKAYEKWLNRVPSDYRQYVLDEPTSEGMVPQNDPYCLATLKHYRSLIPMGQEKRKPIFDLTPADGAIGSHAQTVKNAKDDFEKLAHKIADRIEMTL